MICEKCHQRPAKVFLTQILNGQMQKVDLCEHCARELGVTQQSPFSLADLLTKIEDPPKVEEKAEDVSEQCEACGRRLDDVRRQGWLGCPACYQAFRVYLEESLQTTQKGLRHVGKVPASARILLKEERCRHLRQAIDRAVREENYEVAAQLKEELRLLTDSTRSV